MHRALRIMARTISAAATTFNPQHQLICSGTQAATLSKQFSWRKQQKMPEKGRILAGTSGRLRWQALRKGSQNFTSHPPQTRTICVKGSPSLPVRSQQQRLHDLPAPYLLAAPSKRGRREQQHTRLTTPWTQHSRKRLQCEQVRAPMWHERHINAALL